MAKKSFSSWEHLDRLSRKNSKWDETEWCHFDRWCRGVVEAFARRMGLNEEDAAEVAQETLAQFSQQLGDPDHARLDTSRSKMSTWIFGIALIYVRRTRERHHRDRRLVNANLDQQPCAADEAHWETEWRQRISVEALRVLSERTRFAGRTIEAFRRFVIHEEEAAAVAAALNMTLDDLYVCKHRCLKRLGAILEDLERVPLARDST